MKKLKLFPKTFIYVTGLMLGITLIAHALIYVFMPVIYTNQKKAAIEKDTDALIELLEPLSEEEYGDKITQFVKGTDLSITLSFSLDGTQIFQMYGNKEENAEKLDGYEVTGNSEGIANYDDVTNDDNLSVERTFSSVQDITYQIKSYLPLEPVREASDVVLTLLPITLIICIVVSSIFAFIYSKAITKPIRRISAITHRMEQLDRKAVCPVTGHDEIGTLAEDLNSLYGNLLATIDRLEDEITKVSQSEQSKADFLRTASHELKTPITAVSGMLEGMIHNIGRYKDRDAYLPECKKQIDELGVMLREILEASKLDMYTEVEHTEAVDLDLLMDKTIEPYRLIAKSKNVNVVYIKDGSFTAELPDRLFSKAVSNIISNAVNYTAPGKNARIYFKDRNIIIENECTPIHKDVLAHLSEPFYRPDFDHNHDSGGNGLGLYITDKVLSACGIGYTFEPMESKKGMRFTIHL